ncbi:flagellar assembly protein A [Sporosarcina sp. E16_8]|uniref:flagellar assembly protein A n=1 Tax=Sporosarcina sp. E16_8 TaxID=2789295 RepID=UPI001A930FE5|nr:flagellar assembly protein A [Sporosarcina sp. E16_8]MBO0588262.1 FapA family protein [Sporosarcina sp. E16_8]
MGKSITVKAETIEEAIQLALSVTELKMEEVLIEVLMNPRKGLFGLRKTMAEVNVTQILGPSSNMEKTQYRNLSIEEYPNGLDSVERVNQEGNDVLKLTDLSSTISKAAGARIINKKIETQFSGNKCPVVISSGNVKLYMNGKQVEQQSIISPGDIVEVAVNDELIPPHFEIQLIEHDMLAMLIFTPGKKVKRTLHDTELEQVFCIEAEEDIEYYNDLEPQAIVDRLKSLGIQKGLLFPAIKKVTEVIKPFETIVAKGISPIEGLDGDLEMHIDYRGEISRKMEKIDFREMTMIVSVKAGQVIATHIPPVQGASGSSLLGKMVPVKQVDDIVMRLGENVVQVDLDIIATVSGNPTVDWRNKVVKLDISREFHHRGEVDMESGNIRFEGSVNVQGSIHPSMFVGATGTVVIGGSVTKAAIHAMKSVFVNGNVFSSTISVGKQELIISELTCKLREVVGFLERIRAAIHQVLLIRDQTSNELSQAELNHLIRLLLEEKYMEFQDLNRHFIQKVKNHSLQLSSEWTEMASKLYEVFITSKNKQLKDMSGLESLILEVKNLVELYGEKAEPQLLLSVPYAINSVLYSNGNIVVTSKGLYHSSVTAGHDISVHGVCRGGEIIASNKISLQNTGSVNVVKTVIRTGEQGNITIGHAHAGTEVHVGSRSYIFTTSKMGVYARLDDEGVLLID